MCVRACVCMYVCVCVRERVCVCVCLSRSGELPPRRGGRANVQSEKRRVSREPPDSGSGLL